MMLSSTSRPGGHLSHRKESRVNLTGIDDATKASPWYLGRASHKQAVIALDGLKPGAFVVRVSQSIAGAHILSFVNNDGNIRNEVIKLGSRGLRLKRSKVAFPFLSELISFYSDPSHGSVSTLTCVLEPSAMSLERQAEALAAAELETEPSKQPSASLTKSTSALIATSSTTTNTHSPVTATASDTSTKPSLLPTSASMPVMRTRHGRHATDKDGRVLYVFDVIAPRKNDKQQSPGKWPAPPRVQRTRQGVAGTTATMTSVDLVEDSPISSHIEDRDARLNFFARTVPSLSHQHWIVDNITNWVFDDPVFEWTARDVQEWLHSIDCADAARTFREHGIDGQAFATMTPRDIEHLGISRALSEEVYKHLQALMQPSAYPGQLSGPGPMSRSSSQSSVTGVHFDNRAPSAPVSTWDKFAVRMWMLYEAGYVDHVASIFLRAGIDGPALLRQTDSTLRDLGIERPEDRAAILESIAGLSSRSNTRAEAGTRPADIRKWSSMQVAEFLEEHGFGHHASKFLQQHVMGAALTAMQHDALIALGIHDPIERTRLLRIVRQHTSQGTVESPFQASALGPDMPVQDWTASEVRSWLRANNMSGLADKFDANDVDGQTLLDMDREDLRRMGVQDVDRLMERLEQLRNEVLLLASNSGSKLTAREREMLAQSVADAVASRLRHLSSETGADGSSAEAGDDGGAAMPASTARGTDGPDVEVVWQNDTVTLTKGADDATFGLRLGGGSGHDGANRPTVLGVAPFTPADGKLKSGDVLVAANGRSLEDGDLSDVKRLIVRAGSTLTLQIQRPILVPRSADGPSRKGNLTPMPAHSAARRHRGTQYEIGDGNSSSGGFGEDGGSLTRMTPGIVSSFYRTAAHLRGTCEGQQDALDEEPELRQWQKGQGQEDGGDLSFTGENGDTIAAMDFADYELANTLGGSAPRPGLGLRSMPLSTAARDNPAVGTPAHARPSSLLSSRSNVTGEATFIPRSHPAPHETPEFMRRRSTLRRTHAAAGTGSGGGDGGDGAPDMERLVQRTDSLLTQQSSFDRIRAHSRFRPSSTSTPDRSPSVDVTLSPMSHANPLSWSVSKVAAFFQSEHCPEVAKQCKKRKLSGSSLLRMSPHDIINEWEVSDSEEAERAALQVLVLQEEHPCPLAARWSVADVGDWFDHNSLGQLRRPFSKKKIDGVSLCLLRQGQLDSLNVPQHLRHPLMAALANIQQRTEPEETQAEQWSVPEVVDCLIYNDLHSAIPAVQKKKVTGEQLLELTQASLYNMGIRNTDVQTALLNVVARLREKRGGSAFGTPLLSAARASNSGSAFWDGGSGLRGWTTRAVCDWLAYNGLGEHCQRFFDADVSGEQLTIITSNRLAELGVGLQDSERLLDLVDVAMARQRATSPSCVPHGAWSWSPVEVQMWLSNVGLTKHSAALESHGIDGVALVFASDEDLKQYGVEREDDRKQLLSAVETELARNTYPLIFAAANWTQDEVVMWMRRRQHDDLIAPVQTHSVTGKALLNFRAVDLVKLGVPAAVQDILLADIDHLCHMLSKVLQRPELPQEWSSDAVAAWMLARGHAEFAQLCRDLHIGGHVLTRMRTEDLSVLGVQDPDVEKALLELKRSRRMSHTVSAGADLTTPSKHTDTTKAADWSLTDVSKWLARVRLGGYKALFQAHSISGPALLRLTPDDLDRLGIRDAAHRSQLLTQVANLRRGYLPALLEANEEESSVEVRDSNTCSRQLQHTGAPAQDDALPAWLEPELDASRATARLTHPMHQDGAFLIHEPMEEGSAYTMTVVANNDVTQVPVVKHGNKFALGTVSQDFTTLDDLVAFYSDPKNTRDGPVPCVLLPSVMATRDRPSSWHRRSRTAESRPSWDRRFVPQGHVDVEQLLAGRRDGSFFVAMDPGTEKPVLHVAHRGEVVAFPMHEAECKTTGTIGYALDVQPGVVYDTMAEMVDTLRQEQGPLPVALANADVSKDIKQVIQNQRREEPWCWWQLDKPKAEAEAILERKHTGAFVIHRDQADPSSFVLAYKVGNSVHRERVYHTPQAGLFNKGFHLGKAQHKVLPSLRRLVGHYTHTAGELECRLRVSIEPDPSLSVEPQPVRASKRTPRSSSWLYLQEELLPETILGNRGKGAFIVKPSQLNDVAFELVYKKDQALLSEHIKVKTTDTGAFGGFFLKSSPKTVFPTLLDLVLYHQDASHTLACTLNVRQMCLFSRPHPAASAQTNAPVTWVWCQVGVPGEVALKEVHRKPRGAFVVFGYTQQDPGLHLAYKTSDSEHTSVDVVLDDQTGKYAVPALGGSAGDNLEHALIKVFEDEEHSSTLTWPPQPKINGRLLSPGIVRVRTSKEKPWNWWQLEKDPQDALKELEGTRDGAFVIRSHPSGAPQRFLLSYKFQDHIVDEEIIRTPSSSMFSQGFVLGKAQQHVYPSLQALVKDYRNPGKALECPLRVSIAPDSTLQPTFATPPARPRGKTFESLKAAVQDGQEATRKWRNPSFQGEQDHQSSSTEAEDAAHSHTDQPKQTAIASASEADAARA